jgi:molybdate transport system regulatory protein
MPDDLVPAARVWLERQGKYLLGEREAALLSAIDRSRSIKEAAKAAGVSYRTAWACLQSMERSLSRPVVMSRAGGIGGGATTLTDDTRSLVEIYAEFNRRAVVAVEGEFRRTLADVAGKPAARPCP